MGKAKMKKRGRGRPRSKVKTYPVGTRVDQPLYDVLLAKCEKTRLPQAYHLREALLAYFGMA